MNPERGQAFPYEVLESLISKLIKKPEIVLNRQELIQSVKYSFKFYTGYWLTVETGTKDALSNLEVNNIPSAPAKIIPKEGRI